MGASHLAQPRPEGSPPLAGRDGAQQDGGRGAPSSLPHPAAPPGSRIPRRVLMATRAHSLRFTWSRHYEIAACILGGTECWTAVRLDASGVATAADWVTLGVLLREDHGSYPHGSVPARVPWELSSARAGHPGFAIIEVPGGYLAFRGGRAWPEHGEDPLGLPALANALCAQEFEDARRGARRG